jgi:hypothetical protein
MPSVLVTQIKLTLLNTRSVARVPGPCLVAHCVPFVKYNCISFDQAGAMDSRLYALLTTQASSRPNSILRDTTSHSSLPVILNESMSHIFWYVFYLA